MIFIHGVISNINTEMNGIVSIDELYIFLVLYADDQVLYATLPESLQSMLHDIESYCNTWGLKLNVKKKSFDIRKKIENILSLISIFIVKN